MKIDIWICCHICLQSLSVFPVLPLKYPFSLKTFVPKEVSFLSILLHCSYYFLHLPSGCLFMLTTSDSQFLHILKAYLTYSLCFSHTIIHSSVRKKSNCCPNISVHQNHLVALLKHYGWAPPPEGLTSTQVMLILLI
jgi:hypothetical protein